MTAAGSDERRDTWREALAVFDPYQRERDEWKARAEEAEEKLRAALALTYDASITYSSFCDKCGPMDDTDPSDPKFLGTPMMTETLPLRAALAASPGDKTPEASGPDEQEAGA